MRRARRRQGFRAPKDSGREVRLSLTDMAHQGEALGRVEGKVVFAAYGIPGEEVRVRLEAEKAQYMSGEVVEVVVPSPHRVTPRCPHFGVCGGCQLQHISYPYQLELKRRVVAEQMRRIGKFVEPLVLSPLPSKDPWHYRNHARFTVTREGRAGFTHRNSHRFVPVEECFIAHPWINGAKAALEQEAAGSHQLAVRYGAGSGDYLIHPAIASDGTEYRTGQEFYEERLFGAPFQVSAASFFQVNTRQAERLVSLVRDGLRLRGTDLLLDAYAGVGTFALLLAPFVRKVIAIEESRSAVRDALVNLAGLPFVQMVEGRTEEVLGNLEETPDAVILDPPREGCHADVLQALGRLRPRRLAYVSCEPATLARDLRLLVLNGFRLLGVQPVDMFPQTYHIEAVALLAPMEGSDLLLASTSPRRRQLLPALGLPFQTLVPSAREEEMVLEGSPEERATAAAAAKALSLAQEATAGTAVGADTVVVLDGEVLGKPRDAEEALAMLRRLRGREHRVVTGVAAARPGGQEMKTAACSTMVRMRSYSDAEMEAFVASGEALDKAGAYAIQDLGFRPVRSIQGCPANVVGLPLCTLAGLLEGQDIRVPSGAPSTSTPCSFCLHLDLPLEEGPQRQAKTAVNPETNPTKREESS